MTSSVHGRTMSAEQLKEWKEKFEKLDADGSGAVSVAEMEAALRAARPDIPAAAVRALVEEADEDGSGEIEKGEFSRLLKRQLRGDGDGAFLDAVAEIVPSEQTRERAASSLRRRGRWHTLSSLAVCSV